mmetsp:Transcript_19811/g.41754  ORF Transcript_19811/g.41754 Transcript_19811/m.41754 type:complete len:84 (-) Transcript_19811:503-754(-)
MTNTSTTCDEHEDEPRFLMNGRPFSSRKDLTKTIEQLFRAGVDYDDDDDDDDCEWCEREGITKEAVSEVAQVKSTSDISRIDA